MGLDRAGGGDAPGAALKGHSGASRALRTARGRLRGVGHSCLSREKDATERSAPYSSRIWAVTGLSGAMRAMASTSDS